MENITFRHLKSTDVAAGKNRQYNTAHRAYGVKMSDNRMITFLILRS